MNSIVRILGRTVRACLPAALVRKISAFEVDLQYVRKIRRHYWTGVYNSFDEVPVFGADYYNSDEWIASRAETITALLNTPKDAVMDATDFARTLISIALAMAISDKRSKGQEGDLRILDIGGDAGSTYAILKATLDPDDFSEISYTVLELDRCVQDGRKIWAALEGHNPPYKIDFCTDLPTQAAGIDLVYFGSSLQYFGDYEDVINRAIAIGPEYFLFFNSFVGDVKTHCTLQVNVHGTGLPFRKINLDEFLTLFKEKYRLIYKSSCGQNYNVNNFEPEYRLPASSNLLFKRIS
jgi:putative methyltransferase (TIGR04325 family)